MRGSAYGGGSSGITGGSGGGSRLDAANRDAFGRLRVSEPLTIFDSKQSNDNQALFWDETTGLSDISSAHDPDRAATIISYNGGATGGTFIRQTFMRFNYQPGKSQQILMTGILDMSGGGAGITRRVGYFDDDNGLFFQDANDVISVVRRSKSTGTPVDEVVEQTNWNVDVMDGSGISGVTLDLTKTQIFSIDFEWLGVGRVRMFLVSAGVFYLVHEFDHANILDVVYMSTPNLPCRYELVAAGGSAASSIECLCSSVLSEGGQQHMGSIRYRSTNGTHINAQAANTTYALVGIRLKTTHIGAMIDLESISLINVAGDDYEWLILLNPSVSTPVTWEDEPNGAVQTSVGNAGSPSTSTLTGGTVLSGGFVKSSSSGGHVDQGLSNAIRLGSAIDGTRDEIYLACRPLTSGADMEAGLDWREIQ
jgi:hypothetical protein